MATISEAGLLSAGLARLGSPAVLDVQETEKARLAFVLYKRIRNRYQTSFPWSFCLKVAALNQVAEEDRNSSISQHLGYEYVLPSDCSRPIGLLPHRSGLKWQVIGDRFITQLGSPVLLYTRIVTETGKFPEWFVEAVVSRLAMELVPKSIGVKEGLRTELRNEALVAWNEATAIDAGAEYLVRGAEQEYDRSSFVMPEGIETAGAAPFSEGQ